MDFIAHTKNALEQRQELREHLTRVAEQAARYATPFGAAKLAYYVGFLHDIGKYNPAFQQYLYDAEQHSPSKKRGPDHKAAGAILARSMLHPVYRLGED